MLAAPPTTLAPATIQVTKTGGKGRILTLALAGVVVAGAFFGGGFATGRATAPEEPRPGFGRAVTGDGEGLGQIGPGTRQFNLMQGGTITAVTGDTLTLTTADGTEVTYTVDGETTVSQVSSGTVADLKVGDEVSVAADEAEEGAQARARSITAGAVNELGFGPARRVAPSGAPTAETR